LSQSLRGAGRARAAFIAYIALLVLWGWRPFLPELDPTLIAAQLKLERFIPLGSLGVREDVFSAIHVIQGFLLYAPLGAMLAVWPLRPAGPWSNLWPVIWIAGAIEVGHLLIMDRFFDVTNVLVAFAGGGVTWLVVRRSGFEPHGHAFPPSVAGGRQQRR
jgi:hypothetical protein